jgi:hypothetical protein
LSLIAWEGIFMRRLVGAWAASLCVTGLSCFVSSCQLAKNKAQVAEALTAQNRFSSLGIEGDLTWASVRGFTKGAAPTPWSDTYWPLFNKGLSDRWIARLSPVNGSYSSAETVGDQMKTFAEILASNDPANLAILSPAEKYDLLISGGALPAEPLRNSLKAISDAYFADPNIRVLTAKRKDVMTQLQALERQFAPLRDEFEQVFTQLARLASSDANDSSPQMAALQARAQAMRSQIIEITLKMEPLQDASEKLDAEAAKTGRSYTEQWLRQLGGLAKVWPMLADSWAQWADYAGVYEGQWTWMGHCHGWAPASLMEKTPRHSVVVKKDGREILFTEGDIRGLLTKIWADAGPQAMFASKRCNSEKYNLDRRGRILDGKICYNSQGNSCQGDSLGKPIFVRNEYNGAYEFSESIYAKSTKFAVVDRQLPEDHVRVRVYESRDAAAARDSNFTSAVMHVTTGCRDTNPATFHAALVKLIGEKKTGFVLDKTRSSQVWNQPAFAYELTYLPIRKKDGTPSKEGDPVAASDLADPFMKYRAPGTAFLVQMKATVAYGVENGPKLAFAASDDAKKTVNYHYTLELDKDQKIIGGEWGLLPLPGKANAVEMAQWIGGNAPDFLWRYKEGSQPRPGKFSYEIIRKIHECSLSDAGVTMRKFGQLPELRVSECVL